MKRFLIATAAFALFAVNTATAQPSMYTCSNDNGVVYLVAEQLKYILFDSNGKFMSSGYFVKETGDDGNQLLITRVGDITMGIGRLSETQYILVAMTAEGSSVNFVCQ